MVKGRLCVPSQGRDGIWFQHRGTEKMDFTRDEVTSTGRMMSAPFDSRRRVSPASPPPAFTNKSEINYNSSNKFSEHDNRHTFQEDGVYFGNGKETRNLGKQIKAIDLRQHYTNNRHLTHISFTPQPPYHIDSEYRSNYKGEKTEFPPVHRRFPKVYSEPKEGHINLDTTTSDWHESSQPPPKTPLRVLAISQEPFLKHNPFKYSYHGTHKIYPSLRRKDNLMATNILNRYGANYPNFG
ncbi:uncharacterized protein LOC126814912 [Patella vulgata]|uniref:uncharacterized protein LOC126814912 n=1 Tax=Patella vulgata TaxID=6465 RepID=UPI0024A96337|nr:uncharacterized protein LOC126814912 [Patella vulgata]